MSLASPSFPSIKLNKLKPSLSPSPHPWRSPPSSHRQLTVTNSKADGPVRRPAAPSLSAPPSPTPPRKPAAPPPPSPATPPAAPAAAEQSAPAKVGERDLKGGVTIEYQRKVARELQEYFKQKKLEEADQGPAFGFTAKNEISNGRWAMFGFAVGLLTEFATGSDFVQQMKILLSNFGIVDLD